MRAADPNATIDHVFDEDKNQPPERQTVFTLCQMTALERAYLLNMRGSLGSSTLYALHLGLAGVRNFADRKGQPIVFQRDEKAPPIVGNKRPWKAECLDYLSSTTMDDLAALILTGIDEGMKGPEAKNS